MLSDKFAELETLVAKADKILDQYPELFNEHKTHGQTDNPTASRVMVDFENVYLRATMTVNDIKEALGHREETVFDRHLRQFYESSERVDTLISTMFEEIGYLKAIAETSE